MSKQRADPGLEAIRRVRHEISAKFGHDPKRLLEYYRKLETEYSDRLRLQPSLLEEARRVVEEEGVAVNQLINVAVAEKLSALRTEAYFRERASHGDIDKAKEVLGRAGKGNPPVPGDELPSKNTTGRATGSG